MPQWMYVADGSCDHQLRHEALDEQFAALVAQPRFLLRLGGAVSGAVSGAGGAQGRSSRGARSGGGGSGHGRLISSDAERTGSFATTSQHVSVAKASTHASDRDIPPYAAFGQPGEGALQPLEMQLPRERAQRGGCDAVRLTVSDLEEVTRRMLAAVYARDFARFGYTVG